MRPIPINKAKGDISKAKILFFDRGDHTFVAQRLGREAAKVWYYYPMIGANPRNGEDQIGTGFAEIEKIDDFWRYVDKADAICFPSCYDGEFCDWLRERGYATFGSGLSAEIEINRIQFLNVLKEEGLPIPKTHMVRGLNELEEYLNEKKETCWLKVPYCRGDFDTKKFINMKQIEPWIAKKRYDLGKRGSETIEILVQNNIKAVCESGWDGFCLNGKYAENGTVGYEIKDDGYILKVVKQPPKILKNINDRMSSVYEELGYYGQISTEVRITKEGIAYFTDATNRIGSPPGPVQMNLYTNYGQSVFDIARGKMPVLEFDHFYGAQIVLNSSEAEHREVCVEFPKECEPYVKLKNHYKDGDAYYCVPNDSKDGFFGDVAVVGDSIKEVTQKAIEIVEQIVCDGLEYNKNLFAEATEQIEAGKKFGIEL